MKRPPTVHTTLLLALIAYAPLRAEAQATNGTWTTVISSAAGGTKTAISISNSGNVSTGVTIRTQIGLAIVGAPVGVSGFYGAPAGAFSFAFTNFAISPIGYITNFNTGVSQQLATFGIGTNNNGAFAALFNSELFYSIDDVLAYVIDPEPAQFEIDLAFSNFTPGTYNGISPEGPTSTDVALNMEIVPEPSTYALLALSAAGLGGYVLRRRRR